MAKVKIQGHASGTGILTVTAPNTSTDRTITLPDSTGTLIADDGSGNVMVGTTDTVPSNNGASGDAGVAISSDGVFRAARSGNVSLDINRMDSDGDIAVFRKDGTTVGSIGVVNTNNPYISNDADNSGLQFGTNQILPHYDSLQRDNAVDLGSSSVRFKDLYLSSGVVFDAVAGNATSNTLDDYEEGTWTLGMGTVTAVGTCTFVSTYTKIGNVVTVSSYQTAGQVERTSLSGYFTGLPFAPAATSFGGGALIDGSPDKFVGLGIYTGATYLYLTGTFAQDNLRLHATYMTDS